MKIWAKDMKMRAKCLTWNPLPIVIPWISTYCPGTKWRTPIDVPTGMSASSVTGNSLNFLFIGTPWDLKWPTSGFVKCFSFFCPQPIWLTQEEYTTLQLVTKPWNLYRQASAAATMFSCQPLFETKESKHIHSASSVTSKTSKGKMVGNKIIVAPLNGPLLPDQKIVLTVIKTANCTLQ